MNKIILIVGIRYILMKVVVTMREVQNKKKNQKKMKMKMKVKIKINLNLNGNLNFVKIIQRPRLEIIYFLFN